MMPWLPHLWPRQPWFTMFQSSSTDLLHLPLLPHLLTRYQGKIFSPDLHTPPHSMETCHHPSLCLQIDCFSHSETIPQRHIQYVPISPFPPATVVITHHLMPTPFEPLTTMLECFLSFNTLFLVTITSARRASELGALQANTPYVQFHPEKVTLYSNVSFLPKVVSDFHLKQPTILPTFFSSPANNLE